MLTTAGLKLGDLIKASNDDVPEGRVVGQYPAAGTEVEADSSVNVTVSSGPEKKTTTAVPDVFGRNLEEAGRLLSSVGLVLEGSRTQERNKQAGTVISTDPPAGSKVDVGSSVIPTVSSGPRTSPAKPDFLPGKQESKPSFLPGKEKSKPHLPPEQQKPRLGRPRSLPGRKVFTEDEGNSG
jgi:serine/threonine-protein kinase